MIYCSKCLPHCEGHQIIGENTRLEFCNTCDTWFNSKDRTDHRHLDIVFKESPELKAAIEKLSKDLENLKKKNDV